MERMIRAPRLLRTSGLAAFTVACVPTGMKTGVCTAPRSVWNSPLRASPSVAWMSNLNDEHCIAIAEKTILLLHCAPVGVHDEIITPECGHEHEQG